MILRRSSQARSKASLILLLVAIMSMTLAWFIPQAVESFYRGHFSNVVPASPIISLLLAMASVGAAASFVCDDEALALSRVLLGPAVLLVLLYAFVMEMRHSSSLQYLWLEYLLLVIFVPTGTSFVVLNVKSFRLSLRRGLFCDQQRMEVAQTIGLFGTIIYGLAMILIGGQIGWSLRKAFFLCAAIGLGPSLALESYAGLMCFRDGTEAEEGPTSRR